MSRRITGALLLAACAGLHQAAIGANGGAAPPPPSGGGMSSAPRAMTPEELAVAAYNSGLGHRDKALKSEEKAIAAKKDSDRAKEEKKAREEYEKAFKDFKKAAEHNPALPQAYNGMGFAYRKLGDYTKALEMYDRALQMAPNFPDAIEYRGEAYLGLNRLEDAKQAYLSLFAMDRKQADMLMKAMSEWVEKRKTDPAGVDPASLSAFDQWIRERATVAGETKLMALDHRHSTWR
jgi:tetratricopeptide (TPR) repeat protein